MVLGVFVDGFEGREGGSSKTPSLAVSVPSLDRRSRSRNGRVAPSTGAGGHSLAACPIQAAEATSEAVPCREVLSLDDWIHPDPLTCEEPAGAEGPPTSGRVFRQSCGAVARGVRDAQARSRSPRARPTRSGLRTTSSEVRADVLRSGSRRLVQSCRPRHQRASRRMGHGTIGCACDQEDALLQPRHARRA